MMMTRGLLFCFCLSSLSQVTAGPSTPAAPAPSKYLSLHSQSPKREGRLGCSVTLTYLMPTDPVIDESIPPEYDIKFTKEGTTNVLATCDPQGAATLVKGDKYYAVFDKVSTYDQKSPAGCQGAACDENYHHLNVFVHYARLTIYNLDMDDSGTYSAEVSFNNVTGTASTELIIIEADCPDNDRGGSIVNFGFGDDRPPNSADATNHTKSMVMIGPWSPPDSGFTPVSAREGEPATTDERWVVENIQIYIDRVGSCLLPGNRKEQNVCMEGLEVRVYDMNPQIDQAGKVLSETAVATLDQRAYFVPYGPIQGAMNTYPIVTPFRKEPLTMKKGQYLALCAKQQRKAINESGVITTFETTLITEWEESKLAFGWCEDRYESDSNACNNGKDSNGEKRNKWRNFDNLPQTWYSDAPRVSGVPGSQNEAIVEYIDYDGSGEFDAGDFEDLTKITMKVGRPKDENKYLQYGFKAKMVFLETWYPRPIVKLVVIPERIVKETSLFLLYLCLGLLGGLLCCCCFCCVLYGRKAKHLRERRMFMSSMLGQSFNISSETGEPLPPNWYEEKSADGNIYYYNPTTQESMWDIPTFG